MTPENKRQRLEEIRTEFERISYAKPLDHSAVCQDMGWLITELEQAWSREAKLVEALDFITNKMTCDGDCAERASEALEENSKAREK